MTAPALPTGPEADPIALALQLAWPEALSRLLSRTRDLAMAEDALQEAVVRALNRWPRDGVPTRPAAWLVAVARNVHTDARRHQAVVKRSLPAVARAVRPAAWAARALDRPETLGWGDDLLRLVFTCCDPVIGLEERTALALSTVAGLTRDEIANAFLVAPRAMEQRLTRARRRLAARRLCYEVPDVAVAPERLDAVLAVVHLVFNEGYWSSGDETPIRRDLCVLSLSLARSLDRLLPDTPELRGLLALLLLHEARLSARLDDDGHPVPLPAQDRARWDRRQIDRATAMVRGALSSGRPGPYQIEAAIAAVHCAAETADATDWCEIAKLYELLEAYRPTPVVRTNRAFAVGQAAGPEAGLALLAPCMGSPALDRTPFALLVRGALLERSGRLGEARRDYEAARDRARNDAERRAIVGRIAALPEA